VVSETCLNSWEREGGEKGRRGGGLGVGGLFPRQGG
jgi:hypothetical protein